jgi:hypothetical protein
VLFVVAIRKSITRADIKEEMLKQLALQGADVAPFGDLVNDYLALWETKKALIKDIKERGVAFLAGPPGRETWKNNPSVKDLVQVNKQMLVILKELNLTTASITGGDEDEL